MNDSHLLLEEPRTEFENWLLEAARSERPTDDLAARLLAGVEPAPTSAASPASPSAASPSAASSGASGVGGVARWSKWGIGVGLSALLAGFVHFSDDEQTESSGILPPSSAHVVEPAKAETNDALPAGDDRGAPGPAAVVRIEEPKGAPGARSARAPRQVAPSTHVDSIEGELELLEKARRALDGGRTEEALRVLASYERRHPGGQLRQESVVLRVRALEARGDRSRAAALAGDFVEKNPTSAHAPQLAQDRD